MTEKSWEEHVLNITSYIAINNPCIKEGNIIVKDTIEFYADVSLLMLISLHESIDEDFSSTQKFVDHYKGYFDFKYKRILERIENRDDPIMSKVSKQIDLEAWLNSKKEKEKENEKK